MNKLLGLAIAGALSLGTVSTVSAADMGKAQGNWSTWGCNVSWFSLKPNEVTYYSKEQKLPNDIVQQHPGATVTENGNKLDVSYKFIGSNYKYIYDMNGSGKMTLDRLLVDNIPVFDRTQSNSRFKDRATTQCQPSA